MKISEKNIVQELSFCIVELQDIIDELQAIEADTPDIHHYLRHLEDCYAAAVAYLPDVISFVEKKSPQLKNVGDFFLQAIEMNKLYLSEIARINNNTSVIYLETNDMFSLN